MNIDTFLIGLIINLDHVNSLLSVSVQDRVIYLVDKVGPVSFSATHTHTHTHTPSLLLAGCRVT